MQGVECTLLVILLLCVSSIVGGQYTRPSAVNGLDIKGSKATCDITFETLLNEKTKEIKVDKNNNIVLQRTLKCHETAKAISTSSKTLAQGRINKTFKVLIHYDTVEQTKKAGTLSTSYEIKLKIYESANVDDLKTALVDYLVKDYDKKLLAKVKNLKDDNLEKRR